MYTPLPSWPILYLYTGIIAFALSACLMPLAILLLRRFNIMDQLSDAKIHRIPIPRGGGMVIFIAFTVAVLLPNYRDNPMKGVLIGAFLCLLVGAIDDIRGGVPAVIKMGALVVATIIMASFGVQVHIFDNFVLDLLVTILWIVGVTSAFNGIDNMDGLASGVAVIVSGMFLAIALDSYYLVGTETSLSWFGLLAAGLIGANVGFLLFNFNPAKIFMGDSGSFFLGFILASLSVMGEWNYDKAIASIIPILILGVPIFDFAYIIIARLIRGETKTLREVIEHCAPDHLSHRLLWFGFSQRTSVLIIYLLCFVLGATGLMLRNTASGLDSVVAVCQGGCFILLIVMLMLRAEKRHGRGDGFQENTDD